MLNCLDPYSAINIIFQVQLDSKHEAAGAYVDAANCYKKFSIQGNRFPKTDNHFMHEVL